MNPASANTAHSPTSRAASWRENVLHLTNEQIYNGLPEDGCSLGARVGMIGLLAFRPSPARTLYLGGSNSVRAMMKQPWPRIEEGCVRVDGRVQCWATSELR